MPGSLLLIGLAGVAHNILLPNQVNLGNLLYYFFRTWLHAPLLVVSLSRLEKPASHLPVAFRKAALEFLMLGKSKKLLSFVSGPYFYHIHWTHNLIDLPPIKQMQRKIAVAFDLGRSVPE